MVACVGERDATVALTIKTNFCKWNRYLRVIILNI